MKLPIIIFCLTLLSCSGGSGGSGSPDSNQNNPSRDNVEVEESSTATLAYMKLVNDHRKGLGLAPLIYVEEIADLAQKHSEEMAAGEVDFGHQGFSTRCADARSLMNGGNWCGENVARGQESIEAVFASWMKSNGHRANIENPRATHTGLGSETSSEGETFWTQIFLEVN